MLCCILYRRFMRGMYKWKRNLVVSGGGSEFVFVDPAIEELSYCCHCPFMLRKCSAFVFWMLFIYQQFMHNILPIGHPHIAPGVNQNNPCWKTILVVSLFIGIFFLRETGHNCFNPKLIWKEGRQQLQVRHHCHGNNYLNYQDFSR